MSLLLPLSLVSFFPLSLSHFDLRVNVPYRLAVCFVFLPAAVTYSF